MSRERQPRRPSADAASPPVTRRRTRHRGRAAFGPPVFDSRPAAPPEDAGIAGTHQIGLKPVQKRASKTISEHDILRAQCRVTCSRSPGSSQANGTGRPVRTARGSRGGRPRSRDRISTTALGGARAGRPSAHSAEVASSSSPRRRVSFGRRAGSAGYRREPVRLHSRPAWLGLPGSHVCGREPRADDRRAARVLDPAEHRPIARP
jgi:hypothetical protein